MGRRDVGRRIGEGVVDGRHAFFQGDLYQLVEPGERGDEAHPEGVVGLRAHGVDLGAEPVRPAATGAADHAEPARQGDSGGQIGSGRATHRGIQHRVVNAQAGAQRGEQHDHLLRRPHTQAHMGCGARTRPNLVASLAGCVACSHPLDPRHPPARAIYTQAYSGLWPPWGALWTPGVLRTLLHGGDPMELKVHVSLLVRTCARDAEQSGRLFSRAGAGGGAFAPAGRQARGGAAALRRGGSARRAAWC